MIPIGCGCNKGKITPRLPQAAGAAGPRVSEARMYDVFDPSGAMVASSTNIVFARVEARRTGGTVVPRELTPALAGGVTTPEQEG